jgi:hypothetical protein
MVSVTTILRSGYHIATILPLLLWIPVGTRLHLRRARKAFEDELLNSGLEPSAAHQLAGAFNDAFKDVIRQVTSPRNWMQIRGSSHDDTYQADPRGFLETGMPRS